MESFLRRRGVTVPGMSLAALVGTEFSNPALPAHVTASIVTSTTAALATGAAAPSLITKLIVAMSTAKMAATATGVFLLLAATAGWQQQANASLRKDLDSRKAVPESPTSQSAASGSSGSSRQPRNRASTFEALRLPLDARALVRAFLQSEPRVASLYDPVSKFDESMLEGMTPDRLSTLIHELHGTNASAQVLVRSRIAGSPSRRPNRSVP